MYHRDLYYMGLKLNIYINRFGTSTKTKNLIGAFLQQQLQALTKDHLPVLHIAVFESGRGILRPGHH